MYGRVRRNTSGSCELYLVSLNDISETGVIYGNAQNGASKRCEIKKPCAIYGKQNSGPTEHSCI